MEKKPSIKEHAALIAHQTIGTVLAALILAGGAALISLISARSAYFSGMPLYRAILLGVVIFFLISGAATLIDLIVLRHRRRKARSEEVSETPIKPEELPPVEKPVEHKLKFEIDTKLTSSIMLIPNKHTESFTVEGSRVEIPHNEFIIKAYLKVRFRNIDQHKSTIESMKLSLCDWKGKEVVATNHDLDVYPENDEGNDHNKIRFSDGFPIEGQTITPYYWLWHHLEVSRESVLSIGSGYTLRLTMVAIDKSSYSVEINNLDWESARNIKTYILSQNVGSMN
jgi:hypothetical protein